MPERVLRQRRRPRRRPMEWVRSASGQDRGVGGGAGVSARGGGGLQRAHVARQVLRPPVDSGRRRHRLTSARMADLPRQPVTDDDGRRRQGARGGAPDSLHPFLVHRRPGPAEVVLDQLPGTRRRVRGGDGLRRVFDHGVQRDRGVGHDRDARPEHLRGAAVAPGGAGGGADVLRRHHPRADPVRGRPPPRAAPGADAGAGDGLRHVQRRARSSSTSCSATAAPPRCWTAAGTST